MMVVLAKSATGSNGKQFVPTMYNSYRWYHNEVPPCTAGTPVDPTLLWFIHTTLAPIYKNRLCRYHVPGTNTSTHIVETPVSFEKAFPEALLGELGILSCLNLARCGYHVPGTNAPTHIVETPVSFEKAFPEASLGELGRLSCLDLATEPSPPRSADGSFLSGGYSP